MKTDKLTWIASRNYNYFKCQFSWLCIIAALKINFYRVNMNTRCLVTSWTTQIIAWKIKHFVIILVKFTLTNVYELYKIHCLIYTTYNISITSFLLYEMFTSLLLPLLTLSSSLSEHLGNSCKRIFSLISVTSKTK